MWSLIVSVPDHCISFYFPKYREIIHPLIIETASTFLETPGKKSEILIVNLSELLWYFEQII